MAGTSAVKNYQTVSPTAYAKLKGILKWARTESAHPFSECKRALIKRGKTPEQADKICGVMKDMAFQTTHWRKGGKRRT